MRAAKHFFTETYTIKRNPEADEDGKIGVPVTWKADVMMTPFWPLVALMRLAKAPQTPFEVKAALTSEMGILEGDIAVDSNGVEWHVEGIDVWDDETLEVFAWLIH